MPKRHVILVDKTTREQAELSPATMQELGLVDGAEITITSATTINVLPVAASNIGPNDIRLPRKAAVLIKEGERITVEPARETLTQPAAEPRPVIKKTAEPAPVEWETLSRSDFDEIAGLEQVKARIDEALFYLTHPEWFLVLKNLPPRVFLFFGPYGCGKTMLAKAMASRLAYSPRDGCKLDVKLKSIRSTEVKDPYLGMSARHLEHFLTAARQACNQGSTVLLLLDEIDSLVSNRADNQTHEEYRDVVNSIIQDIQGLQELETEARIRRLWKDPQVVEMREKLATMVRSKGHKDALGNTYLPEKDWTDEVRQKMMTLRERVMKEGGVSTVIIVGTTNDPSRLDEAFVSRAGDNVFFVPRPSAGAIEAMLRQQLDGPFVELTDAEHKELAQAAFRDGLTGRDIMLSWLQPLRNMTPGSLRILRFKTVRERQPKPTVGIEWEIDLYKRLKEKGHLQMAEQVADYLEQVWAARKPDDPPVQRNGSGGKPGSGRMDQRQPALFDP